MNKDNFTKMYDFLFTARSLQFVALLFCMLVITLPFYSANVLATSLSITQNTGTNQYPGYIDAQSDTWSVVAQITGYSGEVIPGQVQLEVGTSQVPFSSCSSNTCTFLSPLDSGIAEGSYPFRAVLYDLESSTSSDNTTSFSLGDELASDSDIVKADGSAPDIQFNSAVQSEDSILLDFEVLDQPNICIGLDTIDIIDSDSGTILQTIDVPGDSCDFNYVSQGGTLGLIPASFEGEGKRHIKIRATDLFGHSKLSSAKQVDTDFVVPRVVTGSLSLPSLGSFVGTNTQTTDVYVNVTECDNLFKVTATSNEIEFFSQLGTCDSVDASQCLFSCKWTGLQVTPSGNSISAVITMEDDTHNIGQGTVTKSFVSDTTAPVIVSFGSEYVYEERSYVPAGETSTIFALIDEDGSGLTTQNVAANLDAIGGTNFQNPDECVRSVSSTSQYICSWTIGIDNPGSTQTKEINIRYLEDNVGNQGILLAKEIVIDAAPPIVHELELYGFSAIGKKDYFQSNDDVVIELTVSESSGLVMYVDATDIVMDAETKYQHGETINGEYEASELDGWAKFVSEEVCTRDEETLYYECELRVDSIKSGYDSSAEVVVDVRDTAQNSAVEWPERENDAQNVVDGDKGNYNIEIFALDEETQPDLWEQGPTTNSGAFIDVDIAHLTYPRIAYDVGLNSENSDVSAKLISARSCASVEEGAPTVSRTLLYGGIEPGRNPHFTLLVELEPFERDSVVNLADYEQFDELVIEYTCEVDIYSVVDDTALNHAEVQVINLDVPFAFSENGALDENVNEKIKAIVSNTGFQILDKIKILNKILDVINIITPFITTIIGIIVVVRGVQDAIKAASTAPPTVPAGTSACISLDGGANGAGEVVQVVQNFLAVFSCAPTASPTTWYGKWQKAVLTFFNIWKAGAFTELAKIGSDGGGAYGTTENLAGPNKGEERANTYSAPLQTVSLKENIWTSMIGLCIPGILYNLEKLRQIYCVELVCLKNDVPAGVTTVDGCATVREYMVCKYFLGELVGLAIPFTGFFEAIKNVVKDVLTDPIGNIRAVLGLVCLIGCTTPNVTGIITFCNGVKILNKVFDMIMSTWSGIEQIAAGNIGTYDYCEAAGIDTDPDSYATDNSVTTDDVAGADTSGDGEPAEA